MNGGAPPDAPHWLKELEAKRKRRARTKLGHEAGFGSPCSTCKNNCPGLDLHFWKKICKNCGCGIESHGVRGDNIYADAQFRLLIRGPSKSIAPEKREAVRLESALKGQRDATAMHQKQVPASSCNSPKENDIKETNDLVSNGKFKLPSIDCKTTTKSRPESSVIEKLNMKVTNSIPLNAIDAKGFLRGSHGNVQSPYRGNSSLTIKSGGRLDKDKSLYPVELTNPSVKNRHPVLKESNGGACGLNPDRGKDLLEERGTIYPIVKNDDLQGRTSKKPSINTLPTSRNVPVSRKDGQFTRGSDDRMFKLPTNNNSNNRSTGGQNHNLKLPKEAGRSQDPKYPGVQAPANRPVRKLPPGTTADRSEKLKRFRERTQALKAKMDGVTIKAARNEGTHLPASVASKVPRSRPPSTETANESPTTRSSSSLRAFPVEQSPAK